MKDPYLDLINQQWDGISTIYSSCKDYNPILEYNLEDEKIFSYSAMEYINFLSIRTRKKTEEIYKEACDNKKFFLFVKDNKNKKLKSYILDVEKLNIETSAIF